MQGCSRVLCRGRLLLKQGGLVQLWMHQLRLNEKELLLKLLTLLQQMLVVNVALRGQQNLLVD